MTDKQSILWRTQPPDKEGWWWAMKKDGGIQVMEAADCNGEILILVGIGRFGASDLHALFKLWAGPIKEPLLAN